MLNNKMQVYEDVTLLRLTEDREQELLDKHIKCNFVWANKAGHALGIIMNYVAKNGHIWLAMTKQQPRVKALQRDPRASVIISSMSIHMGPGKPLKIGFIPPWAQLFRHTLRQRQRRPLSI
jgi:hypothetical protein